MAIGWIERARDRIVAAADDAGSWGYRPGLRAAAEPTSIACLALSRGAPLLRGEASTTVARGLAWLAGVQRADGGVGVYGGGEEPAWTTSLVIQAWQHGPGPLAARHTQAKERAVHWLMQAKGAKLRQHPAFGHDLGLVGWSWVNGTHSWVEPTAYAMIALRAEGLADHPRVAEGTQLLLDRALPTGGWNYGNTRVLNHMLRPFPATTGIALCALADEPAIDAIQRSMDYLSRTVTRIRAPQSLSWSVLGLCARNACPPEAEHWLEETAMNHEGGDVGVIDDGLLVLASHAVQTARAADAVIPASAQG